MPKPTGNLGCVFTDAPTAGHALERVTQLGLNPGGDCAIWLCNHNEADQFGHDKLIPSATMRAAGYKSHGDVKKRVAETFMDNVEMRVCAECNGKLAKGDTDCFD